MNYQHSRFSLPSVSGPKIYFDYAASAPILPELRPVLLSLFENAYPNLSWISSTSRECQKIIDQLSQQFLNQLKAPPNTRILFTSGGTESNNLALKGYLIPLIERGRRPLVISSAVEHPSVWGPLKELAKKQQIYWKCCRVQHDGSLDLEHLEDLLNPDVVLVSCIVVQNEVGTLMDIGQVRELIQRKAPQAVLHLDAVQALGKVTIDWFNWKPDLVSFSGHKIHGPGNIGTLLVNPNVVLYPLFHGGGQQEALRSGSLDAPSIISFLLAGIYALQYQQEHVKRMEYLRGYLIGELCSPTFQNATRTQVTLLTPVTRSSPAIVSFLLKDKEGAVVARMLDQYGICVGIGSACSAGKGEPSSTLLAMGYSKKDAYSMIRISLGYQSTWEECQQLLVSIQEVLKRY